MTESVTNSWPELNQRHLVAAVAAVRSFLEKRIAAAHGAAWDEAAHERRVTAEAEARSLTGRPPALVALAETFGLSPFELQVVLLCAGPELDSGFAATCAAAQGAAGPPYPTFSLALAALPGAHWDALSPDRPLRRWRLVSWVAGDSVTQARLKLDERILHFLTGIDTLDERLAGLVTPVPARAQLRPSQLKVAARLGAHWKKAGADGLSPVVQLCGGASELPAIAAAAAAAAGRRLWLLRGTDVPAVAADRGVVARLWEREARLEQHVLLIETDLLDAPDLERVVAAFVDGLDAPVVLGGAEPVRRLRRAARRVEVPAPEAREQKELWRAALGLQAARLNGSLDRIIDQFHLAPDAIAAVAAEVATMESPARTGARAQAVAAGLWEACRRHARARIDDLAQRIEPPRDMGELILPAAARTQLAEIEMHLRHRAQVYDQWGFAAQSARGLGINALFAGGSGTGKTMAAEKLAQNLRLDLYRIDLSAVVSKYIGETEKNLRRIFDAAEGSGAILLFDEADALFGRRTEVRDSHDRYANIEVSYLLQRMEAYRGLALLTTNLKDSLDPAFLRRLRFVVEFPFPDAAHRQEIWRQVLPKKVPRGELDHSRLARLNLTGGNIRNVAVHAAFLAADGREKLQMKHLLQAARAEYAKLERPLPEAEIRGWV